MLTKTSVRLSKCRKPNVRIVSKLTPTGGISSDHFREHVSAAHSTGRVSADFYTCHALLASVSISSINTLKR